MPHKIRTPKKSQYSPHSRTNQNPNQRHDESTYTSSPPKRYERQHVGNPGRRSWPAHRDRLESVTAFNQRIAPREVECANKTNPSFKTGEGETAEDLGSTSKAAT